MASQIRYPATTPTHQVSESPGLEDQNIAKPKKDEANIRMTKRNFFADILPAIVRKSKSIDVRNRQPKIPVIIPCLNVNEFIYKINLLVNPLSLAMWIEP